MRNSTDKIFEIIEKMFPFKKYVTNDKVMIKRKYLPCQCMIITNKKLAYTCFHADTLEFLFHNVKLKFLN